MPTVFWNSVQWGESLTMSSVPLLLALVPPSVFLRWNFSSVPLLFYLVPQFIYLFLNFFFFFFFFFADDVRVFTLLSGNISLNNSQLTWWHLLFPLPACPTQALPSWSYFQVLSELHLLRVNLLTLPPALSHSRPSSTALTVNYILIYTTSVLSLILVTFISLYLLRPEASSRPEAHWARIFGTMTDTRWVIP